MARDHYIPRTYLRHFTKKYLSGERGGELAVYNLFNFRYRRASINVHIGFEEGFYANHAIDKRWQAEEMKWPRVVEKLQSRADDVAVISDLLRFAAIQVGRVPVNMERVAKAMAFQKARKVPLPGQPGRAGMIVDMVSTAELLDAVDEGNTRRIDLFGSFTSWTCHHSQTAELLFTSDNPCLIVAETSSIYFPLSANLALIGHAVSERLLAPRLCHRNATPETVRKINALIVKGAKDFIYAADASAGLGKFIEKHRKGIDRFAMAGRTFAGKVEPIEQSKFHDLLARVNKSREEQGRAPC